MLTALVQITSRSYVDCKECISSLHLFIFQVSSRNMQKEISFTKLQHSSSTGKMEEDRGEGGSEKSMRPELNSTFPLPLTAPISTDT